MKKIKFNPEKVEEALNFWHQRNLLIPECLPALQVALDTLRPLKTKRAENLKNQIRLVKRLGLKVVQLKECPEFDKNSLQYRQVKVFVMCEGGFIGRFAAEQPGDFYIDDRCSGFQFKKSQIEREVAELAKFATDTGLDLRQMPRMPQFHNCGEW